MFILFEIFFLLSGKNLYESTAFGIVKQEFGLNFVRRQKLSLHAFETQIAASRSLTAHFKSLLRFIPAASWKPKSECSVKTVFNPYNFAAMITVYYKTLVD